MSTSSLTPKIFNEYDLDKYFQKDEEITIIGFGSLLSEKSSRGTFPDLKNFRLVKVEGYRRLFQHPAFIFFDRGIADSERMSSLSTEPAEGCSFLAVAFEMAGETKEAWLKREEEFSFSLAPYSTLNSNIEGKSGLGLMWYVYGI